MMLATGRCLFYKFLSHRVIFYASVCSLISVSAHFVDEVNLERFQQIHVLTHKSLPFFFLVLQVIRMTKYDYRLSNKLDTDLQKLRCRVNYHALRFTDPIQKLGEKIIQRMRENSRYFIALHLRYTQFKLHSVCIFPFFTVYQFQFTPHLLFATWKYM